MTSVSAAAVAARHLHRVGGSVDPDYAYLLASVLAGAYKPALLSDLPDWFDDEIIPAAQQFPNISAEDFTDVRSLLDHLRAGAKRDDLLPFRSARFDIRAAWRVAFREDRYSDWVNAVPLDYGRTMQTLFHAAIDAATDVMSPALRSAVVLLPKNNPFHARAPNVFGELAATVRRCRTVGVPVASAYTQHMLAVRRLTDVDLLRRIDPEYREKIAYLLSSGPDGFVQAAELAELVA